MAMDEAKLVRISKFLSLHLRHRPEAIGLRLDAGGWVDVAELLAACRRYPGASNARRITFEYVMLKGVNDSEADARELVRLIAGMPAKVNLIPFNPWPGAKFERSSGGAIDRFFFLRYSADGHHVRLRLRVPGGADSMAVASRLDRLIGDMIETMGISIRRTASPPPFALR